MIFNLRRRQGPLCSHIVLYLTPFHICIVVYYMLFTTSEFLDRNHYFVYIIYIYIYIYIYIHIYHMPMHVCAGISVCTLLVGIQVHTKLFNQHQ